MIQGRPNELNKALDVRKGLSKLNDFFQLMQIIVEFLSISDIIKQRKIKDIIKSNGGNKKKCVAFIV